MKCFSKIPHRYLICLSLSVAFSFCLSVFGFVSESHATSGTCTWNFTHNANDGTYVRQRINSICPNVSNSYFRVNSYSINFTTASSGSYYIGVEAGSENVFAKVSGGSSGTSVSESSISNYMIKGNFGPFGVSNFYVYFYNSSSSSYVYNGSITMEYSDSVLFDAPVCPEVPDNPYDQKLDDIKKAIYTASAVMIMLYFFFIVYKIIVKNGGSR